MNSLEIIFKALVKPYTETNFTTYIYYIVIVKVYMNVCYTLSSVHIMKNVEKSEKDYFIVYVN